MSGISTPPSEQTSLLKPGEMAIVVDSEQNVRIYTANADLLIQPFQMAVIDAVIRCGLEPDFARACLEAGQARRKKAA